MCIIKAQLICDRQRYIHREAKETKRLHKLLQLFNDLNNFAQIKRILHKDLFCICSENLNIIG